MVPNAADAKLPLGSFNGGVLDTLKASARNSRLARSVRRKVLASIRSAFCRPGPRTGLREVLPIVNCGACEKAATLNHPPALRFGRVFALGGRFGRWSGESRL